MIVFGFCFLKIVKDLIIHSLGIQKNARVSTLLHEGFSIGDVSIKENISKLSVDRIRKLLKHGLAISDLSRSGRPRLFCQRQETKITRHAFSSKH